MHGAPPRWAESRVSTPAATDPRLHPRPPSLPRAMSAVSRSGRPAPDSGRADIPAGRADVRSVERGRAQSAPIPALPPSGSCELTHAVTLRPRRLRARAKTTGTWPATARAGRPPGPAIAASQALPRPRRDVRLIKIGTASPGLETADIPDRQAVGPSGDRNAGSPPRFRPPRLRREHRALAAGRRQVSSSVARRTRQAPARARRTCRPRGAAIAAPQALPRSWRMSALSRSGRPVPDSIGRTSLTAGRSGLRAVGTQARPLESDPGVFAKSNEPSLPVAVRCRARWLGDQDGYAPGPAQADRPCGTCRRCLPGGPPPAAQCPRYQDRDGQSRT
jgi:hypothetical protein